MLLITVSSGLFINLGNGTDKAFVVKQISNKIFAVGGSGYNTVCEGSLGTCKELSGGDNSVVGIFNQIFNISSNVTEFVPLYLKTTIFSNSEDIIKSLIITDIEGDGIFEIITGGDSFNSACDGGIQTCFKERGGRYNWQIGVYEWKNGMIVEKYFKSIDFGGHDDFLTNILVYDFDRDGKKEILAGGHVSMATSSLCRTGRIISKDWAFEILEWVNSSLKRKSRKIIDLTSLDDILGAIRLWNKKITFIGYSRGKCNGTRESCCELDLEYKWTIGVIESDDTENYYSIKISGKTDVVNDALTWDVNKDGRDELIVVGFGKGADCVNNTCFGETDDKNSLLGIFSEDIFPRPLILKSKDFGENLNDEFLSVDMISSDNNTFLGTIVKNFGGKNLVVVYQIDKNVSRWKEYLEILDFQPSDILFINTSSLIIVGTHLHDWVIHFISKLSIEVDTNKLITQKGLPDGFPCLFSRECLSGNCKNQICCRSGKICCKIDAHCRPEMICDKVRAYCIEETPEIILSLVLLFSLIILVVGVILYYKRIRSGKI
jgi:hypothetical protein